MANRNICIAWLTDDLCILQNFQEENPYLHKLGLSETSVGFFLRLEWRTSYVPLPISTVCFSNGALLELHQMLGTSFKPKSTAMYDHIISVLVKYDPNSIGHSSSVLRRKLARSLEKANALRRSARLIFLDEPVFGVELQKNTPIIEEVSAASEVQMGADTPHLSPAATEGTLREKQCCGQCAFEK